jgi:hypothetical protein
VERTVSNRHRRAQVRAEQVRIETEAKLRSRRGIDTELAYPGVGDVLLRLAWLPSFEPCVVWEIRSHNAVLAAYRSHGLAPGEPLVVGHQRLNLDDSTIRAALDGLSAFNLPFTRAVSDVAVADGERYVATIFSGFDTSCRISWIAGSEPAAWSSAVQALVALQALLENPSAEQGTRTPPSEVAHVYCETSSVQLVRLRDGEFQVVSPGAFGSLLSGYDYILTASPVADALRAICGADVSFRDATIVRRATGESWTSYTEVVPIAALEGPHDLPRARLSATRAWHYRHGHLFVNGEVRRALLDLKLPDLSFSPAFALFGGHQAY